MVIPEDVDQHADCPENGDERGERACGWLSGDEGVVELPGEYGKARDAEQDVETIHPEDFLVETRQFRDFVPPAEPVRHLQAGDQHVQVSDRSGVNGGREIPVAGVLREQPVQPLVEGKDQSLSEGLMKEPRRWNNQPEQRPQAAGDGEALFDTYQNGVQKEIRGGKSPARTRGITEREFVKYARKSEERESCGPFAEEYEATQEEPLVHLDECEIPAAAPEFVERPGFPRTVDQQRHAKTSPAQQPGKDVAESEMKRQDNRRNSG